MDLLAKHYELVAWLSLIPALCLIYLIAKAALEWKWTPHAAFVVVLIFAVASILELTLIHTGLAGPWYDYIGLGVSGLAVAWFALRRRKTASLIGGRFCLPLIFAYAGYALIDYILGHRYSYDDVHPCYYSHLWWSDFTAPLWGIVGAFSAVHQNRIRLVCSCAAIAIWALI